MSCYEVNMNDIILGTKKSWVSVTRFFIPGATLHRTPKAIHPATKQWQNQLV